MSEKIEKTVTISKKEYIKLLIAEEKLTALECYGVDNWQGYDDTMEFLHNSKEYQKLKKELDTEK